jgi:nucleoside-diphosphate-sugar epimerase
MHLAVLGATGRTGVPLVTQALERGHSVAALVRSPTKAAELLPAPEGPLELHVGDLLDVPAVDAFVGGADAVLNVAGRVKGAPDDLQQRAIGNVLRAMSASEVDRLVTLTGAGVRVPGDRPGAADRVFGAALRLAQPRLLADSVAYVDQVVASDRVWTVVRAPRLTDGARRDAGLRVAAHVGGGTGTTLGRADLAAFLLDVVEQGVWSRQAPVVSW